MNKSAELLKNFISSDYGIRGSGRWLRGVRHNSLILDTENGVFFWNSKGIIGGPLDYLTQVRRLPHDVAKKLLKSLGGEFLDGRIPVYDGSDPVPYSKLVTVLWEAGKTKRGYWYKRLLEDETIDRFQLGYFDGWYTIPIFENGELVQIQKRKDDPKLIFPWYKGVEPKIFNSDILDFTDTVILTEGIVDAILLNQIGLPAVSKNIGANAWNNKWFNLFRKQKLIYIVYDNDSAGRAGASQMASKLGLNRCKIYTFTGYPDKYDIVDWFKDFNTLDDLMKLIREESKYGFEIKI